MKMWMAPVERMCTKHLQIEHTNCGHLIPLMLKNKQSKKISELQKKCIIDLDKLIERHDEIVKELLLRGYPHTEHDITLDFSSCANIHSRVNKLQAWTDLCNICKDCRSKMYPLLAAEVRKKKYNRANKAKDTNVPSSGNDSGRMFV